MRCFITGGTGFIGQRLVRQLLSLGHEVKIITRKNINTPEQSINYLNADLLTVETHELVTFISDCDVIFHCAGALTDDNLMRSLHIDATKKILEAVGTAIRENTKKMHWVQLSSVGAYGAANPANSPRVVTEQTNTNPTGEYEITKTLSDELLLTNTIGQNFSYTILRPSNVYGATMTNQSLRSLVRMVSSGKFFFVGSSEAISTYIHVDDVANALVLCSTNAKAKNEIFNLSADCLQRDLISSIAKNSGKPPTRLRVPEVIVRLLILCTRFIPNFPLTKSRIDSLVARTHYDCKKIESYLEFIPSKRIELFINELF